TAAVRHAPILATKSEAGDHAAVQEHVLARDVAGTGIEEEGDGSSEFFDGAVAAGRDAAEAVGRGRLAVDETGQDGVEADTGSGVLAGQQPGQVGEGSPQRRRDREVRVRIHGRGRRYGDEGTAA